MTASHDFQAPDRLIEVHDFQPPSESYSAATELVGLAKQLQNASHGYLSDAGKRQAKANIKAARRALSTLQGAMR